MIDIWVRHQDDRDGQHLCEWPATDLDSIIQTLGKWGIYSHGTTYFARDLVGQIVHDTDGTYFELIIVDDE